MLRIAICDDEQAAIMTIQGYLDELKKVHYPEIIYESFKSGVDFLEHYQRTGVEEHYDIIFMDVEMSEMNGLSTIMELRKIDEHALVIYITNHDEYVYDSFETAPFNYLVKPVSFKDFTKVFKNAALKIEKRNNTFTYIYNHEEFRVYTQDILYFESKLYKVKMHTTKGNYMFNDALKRLYNELKEKGFEYSHGSYLVNLDQILKLRYDKVILQNEVEIPVSPSRSKSLKEAYSIFKYRGSGL